MQSIRKNRFETEKVNMIDMDQHMEIYSKQLENKKYNWLKTKYTESKWNRSWDLKIAWIDNLKIRNITEENQNTLKVNKIRAGI